jgi:hypothetical protein
MKLNIPWLLQLAQNQGLTLMRNGEKLRIMGLDGLAHADLWRATLKRHKAELLPHLPTVEPPM